MRHAQYSLDWDNKTINFIDHMAEVISQVIKLIERGNDQRLLR